MAELKKSLTSSEWVRLVVDTIELEATVSKFNREEIEAAVKTIFELVDQINACGEFDRKIGSERLDDISIPKWTKDFIFPAKVSVMTGIDMRDLVLRPDKNDHYEYDERTIAKAAQLIAQTQKTNRDLVKVSECRSIEATIGDINMSIDGRVFQKDKEYFIPVPMVSELADILGDWSNEDESKMVDRYFLHKFKLTQ